MIKPEDIDLKDLKCFARLEKDIMTVSTDAEIVKQFIADKINRIEKEIKDKIKEVFLLEINQIIRKEFIKKLKKCKEPLMVTGSQITFK